MGLRNKRLTTLSGLAMLVAAVLLVAVACGEDATATPSATSTPQIIEVTKIVEVTKEVPVVETVTVRETVVVTPTPRFPPTGTVTVAYHTFGKEILDKSLDSGTVLSIVGNMYDTFIGATPDGKLTTQYGVLDSYDAIDDTSYVFRLKEGVNWHDGVEMTSEDIKFSLEHYTREEAVCSACGGLRRSLDRVEIVDRYTANVFLKDIDVNFIPIFGPVEGDITILPKHHYEKVGADGFEEEPLGSGPWKFVSRRIGEFIEFEANTDYWNPDRISGFAKLRILVVPESSTRAAMLEAGEVDLVSIDPSDVKRLGEAGLKITGPKNTGTGIVVFWGSYNPDFITNKVKFRKAMALAVDWDKIVSSFYPAELFKRHSSGVALFDPGCLGCTTLAPYPYEPEEAKQLLDEVGYKGETVKFWNFVTTSNPEQREVNEVIAFYWREAGIDVDLIPIDLGAFRPKFATNPQPFDPPAPVGVVSPKNLPSLLTNIRVFMISKDAGGVLAGYWNPEKIDALYAELTTIVDEDERARRLGELQKELYDEYWALPIVLRGFPFAQGPRIAEWTPTQGVVTALAFNTLQPTR